MKDATAFVSFTIFCLANIMLIVAENPGVHLNNSCACVDARDSNDRNAIFYAVAEGAADTVRVLLDLGADLRQGYDGGSHKLIHAVAWYGNGSPEVTRLLIVRGVDVHSRDEYNRTSLHLAAWHGHLIMAKVLVEHGACINCRGVEGETALHLAIENSHHDIVDYLWSVGGVE